MLISLSWVKKYLPLKVSAQELASKTTITSQEVEKIVEPAKGLKKVVVGKVEEVIPMPNSDHLKICQVDLGDDESSQIICGAPNIRAGQCVIVALPGARIKDNIKIKRGKMRGYDSNGMICSLEELGFSSSVVPKEFSDGIYYFPEDLNPEIGKSVFPYLGMDDQIIDLDLTPNRGDLQSIMGAAYEFGSFYHQKPMPPSFSLDISKDQFGKEFQARVEDFKTVPVYKLRLIKGVKVAPSPQWLRNLLWNVGIRPINNIVDVTNYILYLYGQPMHTFDYDRIESKQILVRPATSHEKIKTLDGISRELEDHDLVVTDGNNPIAIAGIMGDFEHEITEKTTDVLLESAVFDARHIRETSKRLKLRSESSIRFERGINFDTVETALNHASALIQELTGAEVSEEIVVGSDEHFSNFQVKTTAKRLSEKIGLEISNEKLKGIFDDLSLDYEENSDQFTVTFPHRRPDLVIEEDLVEEVARMIGYDKLPMELPNVQLKPALLTPLQSIISRARNIMIGCGFEEIVNYTLVPKSEIENLDQRLEDTIILPHPMTEDHEVMRRSLVRGMLNVLHYNQARKSNFQNFFEIGHTFTGDLSTNTQVEHTKLAVALSGHYPNSWQEKGADVDFYDLSGVLDKFMKMIGLSHGYTINSGNSSLIFHPGQAGTIMIEGNEVGVIGKINPELSQKLKLLPTIVFEIDLDSLLNYPRDRITKVEVPKLNPVDRDLSFFIDRKYHNQDIVTAIENLKIANLIKIQLFDVYAPNSEVNSFAYSLTFLNPEKTLNDQEINGELAKITGILKEKFGAKIR